MMSDISFMSNSDARQAVEESGKSITTFYRYAREGKIEFEGSGRKRRYKRADVEAYLRGKLPRDGRRDKAGSNLGVHESLIDVARSTDLYHIYGLEIAQLGLLDAVASNIAYQWQQVNNHLYWMMFNAKDRRDIFATLSVLPLREEVVQRLLRKDITPSQVTSSDILVYDQGGSYDVYIASCATTPDQKDLVMYLMKSLFAFWCDQSISIRSIYTSVTDSTEDTPLMRLLTQCFFTPINHEKDQWELRPLERAYQVDFVKDYQRCLQESKFRKENNSVQVIDKPKVHSIDELRHIYQKSLASKGNNDYTQKVHELLDIDANGNVTRRDGNNSRRVWVGPIRGDDDIRATLRINASLFGPSKNYTEDQLVAFRRTWLEKNHDIYRVLEIDEEVKGFIFAIPFPMTVINRILLGEIRVGDVSIEDLLSYQPGQPPVDVYLQTLGLHKSLQGGDKVFAGSYLIAGMERLITDIGERGVQIGTIYTRSDEPDGLRILGRLAFDEIPHLSERVGKLVFQLDFSQDKPSLRAYKNALEAYRREHTIR